ncbi:hypothetical protein CHUAL_009555 [Chamberlinius hualienensis]
MDSTVSTETLVKRERKSKQPKQKIQTPPPEPLSPPLEVTKKEPVKRRIRRVTAYNVFLQEKIQQNADQPFAVMSSRSSKEWEKLPDKDKLIYFVKANEATQKLNSVTKTEDMKYFCTQCGRKYKKHVHYRLHMKDCGKDIRCDICQERFSQTSNLRNHIRVVHEKINKFNCTECSRAFANQYNLVNHLRTHSGDQPFKCPKCAANFNVKSNLNRHQKMFNHYENE